MNSFEERLIKTFESIKSGNCNDLSSYWVLKDQNNTIKGHLEPVTHNLITKNPTFISLFSQWRRDNPVGFANIFEITDERTENWLTNVLLKRKDRILFVIQTPDQTPVGHLGLSSFNFTEQSCEIDNVVRGIKDATPGIMTFAVNSIIQWSKIELGIRDIYLRVLDDNIHAKNFYKKIGFKEIKRIPLYKETLPEEIRWIEKSDAESITPDRFYSYMKFQSNL